MWTAVNVVKRGPKISDRTKRHHKQLNLSDVNKKIAYKCCRLALSSVFSTLRCGFPDGVLKHEFQAIEVTRFFAWYNFGHIQAMKVILFSKYSKFYVDFENAIKFSENVDGFQDNCDWS